MTQIRGGDMTDGERNIIRNVRASETPKLPGLVNVPDGELLQIFNDWNLSDKSEPLVDWLRDATE